METIQDFFIAIFIKTLLQFVHFVPSEKETWVCETQVQKDSGISNVSIGISQGKVWNFQIFCPEEWARWKWIEISSVTHKTAQFILSEASGTTDSQLGRMKTFNVSCQLPQYIDLAPQGINAVITTFMPREAAVIKIVEEKLLEELNKKL